MLIDTISTLEIMSHDAFEAEFMDCTIWTESKFLYFKKTVMKKKSYAHQAI